MQWVGQMCVGRFVYFTMHFSQNSLNITKSTAHMKTTRYKYCNDYRHSEIYRVWKMPKETGDSLKQRNRIALSYTHPLKHTENPYTLHDIKAVL